MKHVSIPSLSRTLQNHSQYLYPVKLRHQKLKTLNLSDTNYANQKQRDNIGNLIFGKTGESFSQLCDAGRLKEALDVVILMDQLGMGIESNTYIPLLKACGDVRAIAEAKIVHAHMIISGFKLLDMKLVVMYVKCGKLELARQVYDKMPDRNVVSQTSLIAGYAHSGRIKEARQLFEEMPERNVVTWNAMIAGYSRNGDDIEALWLFGQMQLEGMKPNHFTFSNVLSIIAGLEALEHGLQAHAQIIKIGFENGVAVGNALINMYAKCGSVSKARNVFDKMLNRDVVSWTAMIAGYAQNERIEDARLLFDKMEKRNVVSWNAMIAGYAQGGLDDEALILFNQMEWEGNKPNQSTFVSVVKACASQVALKQGKQLHGCIIKTGFESDVYVGSTLIDMYSKCRALIDANKVFYTMSTWNVVSWSVMINGYAQNGRMDDAKQLFEKMPERNVISWNAIITGYIQNGCNDAALKLFIQMQSGEIQLDEFTFSSALSACASSDALELGKQVHAHIISKGFESNLSVGNALVTMYAKHRRIDDACQVFDRMTKQDVVSWTAMIAGYAENGRIEDAQKCFDKMPIRNVVSWNAMITAYLQNGRMKDALQVFEKIPSRNLVSWNAMITVHACEEALELFFYMHQAGVNPDQSTFTGVLSVCTDLAALEKGKQAHTYIIKKEFGSDVLVCNALITMYGKCGDIGSAHQVLNKMQERDLVSWNAMITGYAQHGSGSEALELFEQMQQLGVKPNHITFIGVLSACSHSGLVNEGQCYFHSMNQDNDIPPEADHYTCMVDLLGRAGHLDEANKLIESMPCQPDAVVWGALLGACQLHVNMEIGKFAAERLFELEPQNAAAYVSLSNIYAKAGRWDEAAKVRMLMRDRGVKKKPGCSWIEVKSSVHTFVVGDRSHSQTDKIYALLESLYRQMKGAGYVPDTNFIAHDME